MSDEGGWDTGGYAPIGYRVTPWTTLFPALGTFTKSKTLSSIYVAKIYTYYLTRLQCGQYLTFLSDVGKDICQNDAIDTDVSFYNDCCTKLLQTIEDSISGGEFNNDVAYEKIVKDFEATLRDCKTFYSQVIYSTFFQHYSFFVRCAYGLICVYESNYLIAPFPDGVPPSFPDVTPGGFYDQTWADKACQRLCSQPNSLRPVPNNPFTLSAMLEDAVRLYPVITRDGGFRSYQCSGAGGWFRGPDCFDLLVYGDAPYNHLSRSDDGFEWIVWLDPGRGHGFNLALYLIGLDTVPDNYSGKIRGLPMFHKMPFDFLASYADPSKV